MSDDEAARLAQFGAVLLPSAEGARAVLDLPTGMLLVGERHHHAHGQIDDVERWASTLIAACWEARKQSPNRPGTRPGQQGEDP